MTVLLRLFGMAAVLGAMAFFALGDHPGRVRDAASATAEWDMREARLAATAQGGVDWQPLVWASEVDAAPETMQAAEPPPRLLGVVLEGQRSEALFLMPDGRRIRAAPGVAMPNGAEVVSIEATRVIWIGKDGARHQSKLFSNASSDASSLDELEQ